MKHNFFIVMMMAAAVITSCTKQTLNEEQPIVDLESTTDTESATDTDTESSTGTYTYTVSANTIDTKSDYAADGKFKWSAGDAISVLFHNGATDKFFTLTLTDGAGTNSASFSGQVDEGYKIGGTDGNKWALYPAGSHSVRFSETDATKYPLSFNIPAVTDYTVSGFSANIPMYAISEDGNSFNFLHLGAAYKFTFSGINATKVKLVVENQTTYRLSGNVKLRRDKEDIYLDQAWADGVDKTLTYITNVSDGKSKFYVPVRYAAECFQPIIKLYNAETDALIYTKTAANAKALEKGYVQPINISVNGAVEVPWSFPSQFGIDWNGVTTSVSGDADADAGYDGIVTMKATADADKLYLYLEVKKSALYDCAEYGHSNLCYIYFGDGSGATKYWPWTAPYTTKMSGWMKYNNTPRFIHYDGITYNQSAAEHLDLYCYEIAVNRSGIGALAGTSATICIEITQKYTDASGKWQGEDTQVGFAPARWNDALTVTLPAE